MGFGPVQTVSNACPKPLMSEWPLQLLLMYGLETRYALPSLYQYAWPFYNFHPFHMVGGWSRSLKEMELPEIPLFIYRPPTV